MLIRLDKVSLAFGSRPLLEAAELQVEAGERVCIVGRNGEGKSSLLKLVTREIHPDAGEVWIQPGARVASLQQDLAGDAAGHVYDIVSAALSDGALHDEDWRIEMQVREIIERLQLDGEADFADLSGGWRRRVLLARALVAEPHVLLLDEPTNHLDIEAIEWLENLMQTFPGALLFVSHDRAFINRIATRVVELDRGTLRSWPGNYDAYAKKKAEQLESEAIHNALFDKRLAQEEVWIRKGVEARRTRNEGRVRALYKLREERRDRRERVGSVALEVQEGEKSGKKVFESEDAVVKFGDRTVISGLTTTILRGDRVGIVGPNGAGKSTLIRLLLGELEAASGRVERGTKLQVAYYDQQRAQLQLDRSVMENVADRGDHVIINGQARHASGYLRDFLFRPEQLRTPASALSGGERNRLLLAKLFASPANLLVMDEPTNDLDIDTLELLEEMVADFSGTLLLVSHDRSFLDHVATELLVFTGEGRVQEFVGGYSDWVRYRDGRKGGKGAQSRADAGAAAGARAGAGARATPGVAGSSPASAPMPAAVVAPAAKPATSKRKVSFKDQREFSLLPATIEKLEAEQTELTTRVNAPEFYSGPRELVQGALARMKTLQDEIDAAYLRWAELESVVADTRPE